MKRTHLLLFACTLFCLFFSCKEKEEEQVTYTCVDISGKNYKTVVIGDQVWMAENLATKRFNDNNEIYNSYDVRSWTNKDVSQFAYYNNNSSYVHYGLLYNYRSVVMDELIPEGWRLPTREDWEKLVNYVKTHPSYDSINWVGKSLASSTEWRASNVVGAIGYQRSTNNKFGFNVIPAGYRTVFGSFYGELEVTAFWTKTVESETSNKLVVEFSYKTADIQFETLDKELCGCYIRCIKDSTTTN